MDGNLKSTSHVVRPDLPDLEDSHSSSPPPVSMETPLGNFPPKMINVEVTQTWGQGILDAESQAMLISANSDMSRTILAQTQLISDLGFKVNNQAEVNGPRPYMPPVGVPPQGPQLRCRPPHSTFMSNVGVMGLRLPGVVPPGWPENIDWDARRTIHLPKPATCLGGPFANLTGVSDNVEPTEPEMSRRLSELENVVMEMKSEKLATAARIKELEGKVASQQTELEVRKKSEEMSIGKLNARMASLEDFKSKVEEMENLKIDEFGSLESRITNIHEMEERLDALEEKETIADLEARVGALEGFQGTLEGLELGELRIDLDNVTGMASEAAETLDQLESRVQSLEMEGSWEEVTHG